LSLSSVSDSIPKNRSWLKRSYIVKEIETLLQGDAREALSSKDLPKSVVVSGDAAIALREPKPNTILKGDLTITPVVFSVT
jgi:hypothetical protein